MDQTVYVDMRCFQNHKLRFLSTFEEHPDLSGGARASQRFLGLLRMRSESAFANWKTVGLIDRRLPHPAAEIAAYVTEISACLNPCFHPSVAAVFIDGTPLTQDPRFSLRFVGQDSVIAAAIAYDSRKLNSPVVSQRIQHVARLARLRHFDLVFPEPSEPVLVWAGIDGAVRAMATLHKSKACIAFVRSYTNSTLAPLLGNYNAIVPVLESNDPDARVMDFLERYGGPVILRGTELPETLIGRVSPVVVENTAQWPSVSFEPEELSRRSRKWMRERLGTALSFAIASFGAVSEDAIVAMDFLRSWDIPAELYLIGDSIDSTEVYRIADMFGVSTRVHVPDPALRHDFLVGSDAAVQLGGHDHGLIDCIAAGLRCVTTTAMAAACEAPSYVRRVPDHFSPLHVAEQLALLWEARGQAPDHETERVAYLKTHNFDSYQTRLMEMLDLA